MLHGESIVIARGGSRAHRSGRGDVRGRSHAGAAGRRSRRSGRARSPRADDRAHVARQLSGQPDRSESPHHGNDLASSERATRGSTWRVSETSELPRRRHARTPLSRSSTRSPSRPTSWVSCSGRLLRCVLSESNAGNDGARSGPSSWKTCSARVRSLSRCRRDRASRPRPVIGRERGPRPCRRAAPDRRGRPRAVARRG